MIWLNIHGINKYRLSDGPIQSVLAFEARAKLNAAGDWKATIAAADERAALITPGRYLLAYSGSTDGIEFLGGGTIETVDRKMLDSGMVVLEVSGADLLAELAFDTVGIGEYSSGRAALLAAMPIDWAVIETDTIPDWSTRLAHESVLAAWARAAGQVGFRFRHNPASNNLRSIEFLTTTPASGVRAHLVPATDSLDSVVCAVKSMSEVASSWQIVNQLHVYGAGNYATRGTLKLATVWPDGAALASGYTDGYGNTYTVDEDTSIVDCTSSQAIYGVRAAAVQYGDIAPLSNGTADMRAAANALLRAAVLRMADLAAPQQAYAVEVEALRSPVLPGDSIYVDVQRYVDGRSVLSVRRDLVVVEKFVSWQAGQPLRRKLTVSTTTSMPVTDSEKVAQILQGTINAAALPQASTSVDTICATDSLDDDAQAPFRFWLGEETTIVYQVLMRFRIDPLRSTAKAIGGTLTGSVTLDAHTHSVTIDDHTHSVPDHDHDFTISGGLDPTYPIGFGAAGTSGGLVHNASGSDFAYPTDSDTGSTTSGSGGSSTPTSAAGGDGTFDVDLTEALTLDYGIYEETSGNTYGVAAVEWTVNAVAVTETPTDIGSGWYRLDLTSYVVDASGERPATDANAVIAAIKAASKSGKTCQITVQIERRTSIQPIAYG